MKTAFLASLLLLAQAGYLMAEESCDDEDVNAVVLAKMDIYQSELVMINMNVSSVAEFRLSLDYAIMDNDYDGIKVADSDDDNPGNRASNGADSLQAVYSYYYDVCPVKWYRMYYWMWFFWTSDTYCWPVNSVWLPRCIGNYCKLRPYYYDTWYSHLRCVLEYSWKRIPSVCYNIRSGQWSKAYLRRYLPRGCCCKSYWIYGLVEKQQCEVESSGSR